jgi:hypothetical protein
MSVADATGQVLGGHFCRGNLVRTTAEVLLARVAGWTLDRAHDESTGYKELVVCRDSEGSSGTVVARPGAAPPEPTSR